MCVHCPSPPSFLPAPETPCSLPPSPPCSQHFPLQSGGGEERAPDEADWEKATGWKGESAARQEDWASSTLFGTAFSEGCFLPLSR